MRADMTHLCTEKGAREAEEQESIHIANERERVLGILKDERNKHNDFNCWKAIDDCIRRVEVKEVDGE